MNIESVKQSFIELYNGKKNLRKALKRDRLAVQFAWSVFTDGLCRDGIITMKQYESWCFPWRKR